MRLAEVPTSTAIIVSWLLPPIEISCGLGLLRYPASVINALSAISLLLLFLIFLFSLHRVDPNAKCASFGEYIEQWTGGGIIHAIWRNLALLSLAVVTAVAALRTHGSDPNELSS